MKLSKRTYIYMFAGILYLLMCLLITQYFVRRSKLNHKFGHSSFELIDLIGSPKEDDIRQRVTCYIKSKQQKFQSDYISSGVINKNKVQYRIQEIRDTVPLIMNDDIYHILLKTQFDTLLPDEFSLCFTYQQKVLINRIAQEEVYVYPYRFKPSNYTYKKYILVYGTSMLLNEDPSRNYLQKIFIRSILYLQKHYPIKFVVFNDDPLTMEYATGLGLDICSHFEKNQYNVPVLPSIFKYIESNYESEFYGYINGDIIQSSYIFDILYQLHSLIEQKKIPNKIFLAGRRTNLSYEYFSLYKNYLEFYDIIVRFSSKQGVLNKPVGIDYFITTKGILTGNDMDPIVIGRGYVDNYLVAYASDPVKKIYNIDITQALASIHMDNGEKHKDKQNSPDMTYNVFYYERKFSTSQSVNIHALHYSMFVKNNNQISIQMLSDEEKNAI